MDGTARPWRWATTGFTSFATLHRHRVVAGRDSTSKVCEGRGSAASFESESGELLSRAGRRLDAPTARPHRSPTPIGRARLHVDGPARRAPGRVGGAGEQVPSIAYGEVDLERQHLVPADEHLSAPGCGVAPSRPVEPGRAADDTRRYPLRWALPDTSNGIRVSTRTDRRPHRTRPRSTTRRPSRPVRSPGRTTTSFRARPPRAHQPPRRRRSPLTDGRVAVPSSDPRTHDAPTVSTGHQCSTAHRSNRPRNATGARRQRSGCRRAGAPPVGGDQRRVQQLREGPSRAS